MGRVQTGIAWADHASASLSDGGMQAANVISNGRLTVARETRAKRLLEVGDWVRSEPQGHPQRAKAF